MSGLYCLWENELRVDVTRLESAVEQTADMVIVTSRDKYGEGSRFLFTLPLMVKMEKT